MLHLLFLLFHILRFFIRTRVWLFQCHFCFTFFSNIHHLWLFILFVLPLFLWLFYNFRIVLTFLQSLVLGHFLVFLHIYVFAFVRLIVCVKFMHLLVFKPMLLMIVVAFWLIHLYIYKWWWLLLWIVRLCIFQMLRYLIIICFDKIFCIYCIF